MYVGQKKVTIIIIVGNKNFKQELDPDWSIGLCMNPLVRILQLKKPKNKKGRVRETER